MEHLRWREVTLALHIAKYMESILLPFRYIFGYAAIIGILIPVIASILARRNGVKFTFEIKLFEFYCYSAATVQITAVILAFVMYPDLTYTILFRILTIIEISVFVYLLLKWMSFERFTFRLLIIVIPILFLGDYIYSTEYPDFMLWFQLLIMAILAFLLSYKIDKQNINLPKEYSYIHIGIYLNSIITILGFTPFGDELRSFGHFIHVFANGITIYYYYRSFRCQYP